MHKLVSFFFLVFASAGFTQESTPQEIKGKVNANMTNVEGIYVINLKTEKSAITDMQGFFSIKAIAGDTLMFSSVQFKALKVALKEENFNGKLFFVKMVPFMNQLQEVVIKKYDNINARSFGIIPSNQKSYTEAERKYATASSGSLNPMGLDPLLNFFSGRTAMLKKELQIERKESYLALLDELFDTDQYIGTFHIPVNYIKGFQYFAVDNEKFTVILDQKNKTTIAFLLGELAAKYNEILACEDK